MSKITSVLIDMLIALIILVRLKFQRKKKMNIMTDGLNV